MNRKKKPKERRDEHGRLYCSGTSKRTGKPCKAYAIKGREKCYYHGGKTPRGAASPHTTHGKYSKALPQRLFHMLTEELRNPDLLNLTTEIALTDVRLRGLASELGGSSAAELIEDVYHLFEDFDNIIGSMNQGKGNPERNLEALNRILEKMREVLAIGRDDSKVWRDIERTQDHRRRLIEVEHKRLQSEAETLSMRELALVMRSISEIIMRNVVDESIRENISEELEELLDPGNLSVN